MLYLDLAPSREKLAQAREHLIIFQGELSTILAERQPYTIRISEIDPNSGQCSAFLIPSKFEEELRLGVLIGDIIHNLRCALDYIVSELVRASEIRPTKKHQFPIFRTEIGYRERVGDRETSKAKNSLLSGVKHGLTDIWDVQPFHSKEDPRLTSLFLIHEFSNGDKHRILSMYMPMISNAIELHFEHGNLIELERIPFSHKWEPGKEYEIARLHFAPPYPSEMHSQITVEVYFATEPIDGPIGEVIGITPSDLAAMCECVLGITKIFESL